METYKANIERETMDNEFYRKVIFTGKKMQLVLMSLKPGEEIPEEVHHGIDQFIRVEFGRAVAYVDGKEYELSEDDAIIIPSDKKHRIVNVSGSDELKLYSIYAEPEHKPGTIHKTKEEADKAHHTH